MDSDLMRAAQIWALSQLVLVVREITFANDFDGFRIGDELLCGPRRRPPAPLLAGTEAQWRSPLWLAMNRGILEGG